jgi:hypothetical protein
MELKQGAASDLLQQGPHVEVADSETSAASSDEERLTAGISTIGLQAKGPSGAQRRRLTREGGMEGTWTADRPPGGAPSSRVKGTAGGRWGCEGTPLGLEYTIPRRAATPPPPQKTRNTQVRTGTYKEADAVLPFAARGLSGNTDEETDWRRKWERLKHLGSTMGLQAYVASRAYALGPDVRRRRTRQSPLTISS